MRNVQIGESLTGNLSEGTWTFEVKDLELRAGVFAIIEKDDLEEVLQVLESAHYLCDKLQMPTEEELDILKIDLNKIIKLLKK